MIGLVLVSHSRLVALGTKEIASQMAPGVPIIAAGGTADGFLGTDATLIQKGIEEIAHCEGILLLMDLGSAVLSAEMALDFLAEKVRAKVRLADGPLVEGAVAAAVEASLGSPLAAVKAAAEGAASLKKL